MAPDTAWTAPELLAVDQLGGSQLALAVIGRTPHLAWNRTGVIYHSQKPGAAWSAPVAIAMGEAPALAATPDGRLHCLFANSFAGNYEIYHAVWNGTVWSLPTNVSHTSGDSTQPALAVGPESRLHAVWADTTPGYATIYYGVCTSDYWTSGPIPNGRGKSPTLSVAGDNAVYAAWEDRSSDTSAFDVYCARLDGQIWGLPDLVSESHGQSIEPNLSAGGSSCLAAWLEQQANVFQVYFSERLSAGWTIPSSLSTGSEDCLYPRLATAAHSLIELVWLQAGVVNHRVRVPGPRGEWSPDEAIYGPHPIVAGDLAVATGSNGDLHVAWSALVASSGWQIYYAVRDPELKYQVFLPSVR